MPLHQQITTCRKSGGPTSKSCSCEHCALHVCSVCGAGEGALTTDCPGGRISGERLEEICQTNLDYTSERGWHQGDPSERRSPRFEKRAVALDHDCPACRSKRGEDCWVEMSLAGPLGEIVTIDDVWTHRARVKLAEPPQPSKVEHATLLSRLSGADPWRIAGCSCGWRTPLDATDSEDAFVTHVTLARLAPSVDWETVDRATVLRQELAQKAIAWVLADRIADDHSATLTRIEDDFDARAGREPDERDRELLGALESEKISFTLANQRADKCDDEFRQAARKLVAALEQGPPTVLTVSTEIVGAHDDVKQGTD